MVRLQKSKAIICFRIILILCDGIDYDVMRELVHTAKRTGAKVMLPTKIDYDLIKELSSFGGSNVTFIDGLRD